MAKAPCMPVFTDALLGDTLHLSAEEFGAYCLLLFATWRNNGQALTDDDVELARVCRVSVRKWREKLRKKLVRFFNTDDGFWHQARLEKEWAYVAEKAAISRRNGARGGRPRNNPAGSSWDTQIETTQPHTYSLKESYSQPSPSPGSPALARETHVAEGLAGLADLTISEEQIAEAGRERERLGLEPIDLHAEARKTETHWRTNPPLHPRGAWLGRARIARPDAGNRIAAPPPREYTPEEMREGLRQAQIAWGIIPPDAIQPLGWVGAAA